MKEEVLKILEAMIKNNDSVASMYFEEGDQEKADAIYHETVGLRTALWLLTDGEYVEEMLWIYNVKE